MQIRRYYRSGDAVRLTGVSYRQLDYWIGRGIIRASGRDRTGRGNPRLFTFRDLVEIRTAKRLLDCGLKLAALKEAIMSVRRQLPDHGPPLNELSLLTNGTSVFQFVAPGILLDLTHFGQFAFAFGLQNEIRGLVQDIKSRKYERSAVSSRSTVNAGG